MEQVMTSEGCFSSERLLGSISPFLYHAQRPMPYEQGNPEDRTRSIVKLLLGSSRDIRKGPRPDRNTIECIQGNIARCVAEDRPVSVTISWGTIKTPHFCGPGVDIAELMALEQFASIHNRLTQHLSHGALFNVFLGDDWYRFTYGANQGVETYCSGFESLVQILGMQNVNVARLSELRDSADTFRQASENWRLFSDYWLESSSLPESDWEGLSSRVALKEAGFTGLLPAGMRAHYVDKMERFMPDADDGQRLDAIFRHFAYGLMMKQYDLIGREDPERCTIDFFPPTPPPGTPKQVFGNRVSVRLMPRGTTNRVNPPWCAAGILYAKADRLGLSLLTDAELGDVSLAQKASLRVGSAAGCIELPMDVYRP